MKELIYIAMQGSKIQFYSFDIEVFFEYLRHLYTIRKSLTFTILKTDIRKLKYSYQSLYPKLELVEFYENIYMPLWEYYEWEEYFWSFYLNTLDLFENLHRKSNHLRSYESFMNYLGYDRIRGVIDDGMDDAITATYS